MCILKPTKHENVKAQNPIKKHHNNHEANSIFQNPKLSLNYQVLLPTCSLLKLKPTDSSQK